MNYREMVDAIAERTGIHRLIVVAVIGAVIGGLAGGAATLIWRAYWPWLRAFAAIDYWQAQQLVALLNWIICCAIGWSCVCRISVTSKETTRLLTRLSYAALFGAATYSGWPPLRATWPGWSDVLMNTAVLLLLLDGARRWRAGLPNDVRKERRATPRSDPAMKDAIT